MENRLLDKLSSGAVALGVGLNYPNPNCLEVMAPGWDWIWVDAQHGQHDYATLVQSAQVAELVGVPCIIRGPGKDPDQVCRMPDTHASGVVVPMVNRPDEAARVVAAACYPPNGARSYGGRRMGDVEGREYYRTAHERTFIGVQIETPEAVDRAAEIAAVQGVHELHVGPDDLKIRLGLPINTRICESDVLLDAIARVGEAARTAGKFAGCNVSDMASVKEVVARGCRMIMGGSDLRFIKTGSAAQLADLREATKA